MSNIEQKDTESAGSIDLYTALQEILKTPLIQDGLERGLNQCCKALDKRQAPLCILANNIDEPAYTKFVEVLCTEYGINLLKIEDSKQLGEQRIDIQGKTRKVNGYGCVVVRYYGKESQALDIINEYFCCRK